MKMPILFTLVMFMLVGWQPLTFAKPEPKNQAGIVKGPRYTVVLTTAPWEGATVRVKLTLAGRTLVDNWPSTPPVSALSLKVMGLKPGVYTATVSLLNTDARDLIQTVLGCGIFTSGTTVRIISIGDYSFSDAHPFYSLGVDATSMSAHGEAEIDTAWGKDASQIPDIPFGKDYYARFNIGDTCKIVFVVGSPSATMSGNMPTSKDDNGSSSDTSELEDAVKKLIEPIEGNKAYAYLDSNKGLITIGIGHLVNDEASFEALNFVNSQTGLSAIDSEKLAYYQTLKNLNQSGFYGEDHPASDYLPYDKDNLVISDPDIQTLFDKDVRTKIASLRNYFPNFDSFPLPAREALVDLQYNPGNQAITSEKGWPKLKAAINQNPPDWLEAAKESHRNKISDERNATIYQLFVSAAHSTNP